MFIKVTRNAAGQAYYHLVESYRDGKKVRQRTLLSLGRSDDNKLDALAHAIGKHTQLLSALELAKEVSVDKTYILGPLLIVQRLFQITGLDKALARVSEKHPKLEFDLQKTVFTLIAARFVRPASKLATFEALLPTLYPKLVDHELELQHIYRTMDLLAEHKDDLEGSLYWHNRDLLNAKVDIVLYDLTTLRFESTREDLDHYRRFGFSKEMRSDCTQIILGLLVDEHGIPLGFEVYPGNTFEGHTLKDIVEKMRKKFKVGRFIFVADRGLFSKDNLVELKGLDSASEFIVGMRLDHLRKRADELYDLNRFQMVSEDFRLYETTHGADRLIVTWSKVRAERDRKVREDIVAKLRTKLAKAKTPKSFVSNSNYRRFLKGLDKGGTPALDEEAIALAQKYDGFFGIITNVKDKPAMTLLAQYKELWRIEDAFGELKGTLRARPIFHWTDDRIIGHLTLCFLAHLLEAYATHALRSTADMLTAKAIDQDIIEERPLTAFMALRDLAEVRAVPVTIRDQQVWVRTDIAGNAAKLFSALGVRIPPKMLIGPENVVAQTNPDSGSACNG